MNLDFMKASEAKAMAKDYKNTVTDEHYAQMVREINRRIGHVAEVGGQGASVTDRSIEDVMENINNEIIRRARLGETDYITSAPFEMGEVGLRDFGKERQEAIFRPIVVALRSAGYTVKVGAGYFGEGYYDFTICW